jgi:glutamyl-tRNA reductase
MIDQFKILTITHKKTNLRQIGNFVIQAPDNEALKVRLHSLKQQYGLDELLYLATCNRVMYMFHTSKSLDPVFASHFFQSVNPSLSIDILDRIEDFAYLLEGEQAIQHLFEVAASIDSLVIGERQVLRQLREAYDQCNAWELTGDFIRLAVQQAVHAAKSIYSQTRIGDKPVSVVSLAIQKMLNSGLHKDARILMIGAGQTNQLAAKFLAKHHFRNVAVFNRTLGKAEQLASFLGGKAAPLSELENHNLGFDCLIVCTASTAPVITEEIYGKLLRGKQGRKVVIDLSIPHNVASEIVEKFDVHYIEIEGLRNLAKENLAFREQETTRAREFLAVHLREFPGVLRQRQIELALRSVPVEIKAVKEKAINEVFKNEVQELDAQTRDLLERMMTYMEKKCIGIPMKAARGQ